MAITKVEYFEGANLIGTKTSAPFNQFVWNAVPEGNYALTAKKYEDGVYVATSPVVNTVVNAAAQTYHAKTSVFMNNLGIANDTSPTVYTGVNGTQLWTIMDDYIVGLETDALLTKIYADYPQIGGTGTQHTKNLIDPATLPLTFTGSWVHDALGAQGDGATTWANVAGFSMLTTMQATHALSIVIGTNAAGSSLVTEINAKSGNSAAIAIRLSGGTKIEAWADDEANVASTTETTAAGITTVSKQSASVHKSYRNGAVRGTSIGGGTTPDGEVVIGAWTNAGNLPFDNSYSAQRYQGALITDALSDAEALALANRINTRETALGRKTW